MLVGAFLRQYSKYSLFLKLNLLLQLKVQEAMKKKDKIQREQDEVI